MTTNLGASDARKTHHGQQLSVEPRTSDPTATSQGEWWLRSDVTGEDGDWLAAIRYDSGNGLVDIPILPAGDSRLDYETVQIQVGGQWGVIPILPQADANRAALSWQRGGSWFGAHAPSPIPDNPVLLPESDDLTHFSGSTGAYDINSNTPVFDNDQNNGLSLKHTGSGDEEIGSSSGLPNYPEVGTPHRFAYYGAESDSDVIIYFGYSATDSSGDGYSVRLDYGSDAFNVASRDGGSPGDRNEDASSGLTNNVGSFVEVELLHEIDGALTGELFDADGNSLSTVSITNSDYITSESYDSQNIVIRDRTNNSDALDLWRNV